MNEPDEYEYEVTVDGSDKDEKVVVFSFAL